MVAQHLKSKAGSASSYELKDVLSGGGQEKEEITPKKEVVAERKKKKRKGKKGRMKDESVNADVPHEASKFVLLPGEKDERGLMIPGRRKVRRGGKRVWKMVRKKKPRIVRGNQRGQ